MNLAVFDLETNGYVGASVLSASSIVFDEAGRIQDVFNRFYLPSEPFDFRLTRIHGLSPERLSALREGSGSAAHFIEDWPDLMDFWTREDVQGVVIHNARFDWAFLPEMAQSALPCWCSMKGLTDLCALPNTSPRARGKYKQPRLSEATDLFCNGPSALPPTEALRQAEELVRQHRAHVSLADCFELYRLVVRVRLHHPDRVCFTPLSVPFRMPKRPRAEPPGPKLTAPPRSDAFVSELRAFERRLRAAAPKIK